MVKTKNNYKETAEQILNFLEEKQKEVISRRFGIGGKERAETLESIGSSYGLSRERIRQIEKETLKKISQNSREDNLIKTILSEIKNYLIKNGNFKREDLILADLGEEGGREVRFFMALGEGLLRFSENENFYSAWSLEKDILEKADKVLSKVINILEKEQSSIAEEKFWDIVPESDINFFKSAVEASKKIEKGPLGDFGLSSWNEIKPRGVRDRAYLALKKEKSPLHFTEVAGKAGEINGELCRKRKVYPQTVHNELIKDPRFVLVGKGVYGLKEWGLMDGTVSEVIEAVLAKSGGVLPKEEIIDKVLSQRQVKPGTILLNLQNKKKFQKQGSDKYRLV